MAMTHVWVRAESRDNEDRVGLTPQGVRELMAQGFAITVERSANRAIEDAAYEETGCTMAAEGSWPSAPKDALIFGLKELPDDDTPLVHRHIMFGHAYKGQSAGQDLLRRFRAGGGTLYDLEYLVDDSGRRVAAFGYWAGYAGAAITLKGFAAQRLGETVDPLVPYASADDMADDVRADLNASLGPRPSALIIGALGRVGRGAADLCEAVGVPVTRWDKDETASGGPFPEILAHDVLLNCILAMPGTPVFVPPDAIDQPRSLQMIGDIACDPGSDFNPIPIYDEVTDWEEPIAHIDVDPPLGIMAIDNLPSLLPREASEDFAAQLLPSLAQLDRITEGVWGRAKERFDEVMAALQ